MKYLSVCSGIEAASVAWRPLGWDPWAFSEIEPFPSAVLDHHYPDVPNLGDMTEFNTWPDATIDLLCGGTPCQSFSVAGLRKGLDDPRGDLMLTFGAIARRYRPRWLVWENVPGVLSSNGGRDFGAFLGLLGELGYGYAYRILDAQYVRVDGYGVAVPQRRRRVFVVGYLGDWRRAAAVLFERESLSGNPPPRRGPGARVAATLTRGAESSGRGGYAGRRQEDDYNIVTASRMVAFGEYDDDGTASTLKARDYKDATDLVAHTLRGEGFDASEDGTGRGVPLVSSAYGFQGRGSNIHIDNDITGTIGTNCDRASGGAPCVAIGFHGSQDPDVSGDVTHPAGRNVGLETCAMVGSTVRRLTPRECERLQGFPDNYTRIAWRGKAPEDCPDGPRYKAIGNSWAANCPRWLGRRIERVESIISTGGGQ